ncbi:MAG: hypothetical protein NXI10_01585 [bacterium]|nr:hypothetical protein [bacterium]
MKSISQPSKKASPWVPVPSAEGMINPTITLNSEGKLVLVGRLQDNKAFYYAYRSIGDDNFGSINNMGVGFYNQPRTANSITNYRLVQKGNSPVILCGQGDDGRLYSKFKSLEDESILNWLPFTNGGVFQNNLWSVCGIDDNAYFIYGLGTDNVMRYAVCPYVMGKTAPAFGTLGAPQQILELCGATNIEGQLTVTTNLADTSIYMVSSSSNPISAPRIGSQPQMVMRLDGALQQMWLMPDGNIHGYAQLDPSGPLTGLIKVTAQAQSFKMISDYSGTPVMFAHWKDGSIKMNVANGPNGVFSEWETISESGLELDSFNVTRDYMGGFTLLVHLKSDLFFMCSTSVDDRQGTLTDSKAPAKAKMQQIQELAAQIPLESENNSATPMASPVVGALKDVDKYKDVLVDRLKDIAKAVGNEGFDLIMDAESIGTTMSSHLDFNKFKPHTALDFFTPSDLEKWIGKGISTFKNKVDTGDYKNNLIGAFTELIESMKRLTNLLDMPLPLDRVQLEHHTLPMLQKLPDQVLEHLSKTFPNPDFSALKNAVNAMEKESNRRQSPYQAADKNYKREQKYSAETIRIMAGASAACSLVASIINIVTKTLPLRLGLGVNFVVGATVDGKLVAEVDASAGADAGIGFSIPIFGIGVYVGAGAGNGTLVKVDVIWIGLTPALLSPITALCKSANTILEAMIASNKQHVQVG